MILRTDMKNRAKCLLKGHWGSCIAAAFISIGALPLMSYAAESFGNVSVGLIVLSFLLVCCLAAGNASMFLGLSDGADIETFFASFEDIFRAALAGLIIFCDVFLWSLLFIIPGIAASYKYRMIFYILAVNPDISPIEAAVLSKRMMDGRKWDLFVLDLSLSGWYILTAVTYGLAGIYTFPYCSAVYAVFYEELAKEYNCRMEFEHRRMERSFYDDDIYYV